jgi:hypothetical protein
MTMRWTTILGILAALILMSSAPAGVRAQEPTDAPPKPAGTALPSLDDDQNQPSPDTMLPDGRPLTGVQNQTLGQIESPHSYWIPGIQYSNTIQNLLPGSTSTGWSITNYVAANVSLLDTWRSSQLALNYSGGGSFSTDSTQGNGSFQQLGVSQTFKWARWQLQFFDQFSYLPQSQFGFGAGTGLGLPGGGIAPGVPQTGLTGNYQTLFNAVGPRFNNNFTTQVVYQISARGSLNVSGNYSFLKFVDPGNIDNNDAGASVGYNYLLTKVDTLGLVYRFNHYSYIGDPQVIDDSVINVAYGRKITGRIAFQAFGGPDITSYKVHTDSPSRRITASGGANLTYAIPNGSIGITYNHGVSGGSGVFAGSETDQVGANVARALGRVWHAQANMGYSHNSQAGGGTVPQSSYNSLYVGGGVNRAFGPNMNFNIAYNANIQTTGSQTGCTGNTCDYTQQQISMNFQWHTRPLVLK